MSKSEYLKLMGVVSQLSMLTSLISSVRPNICESCEMILEDVQHHLVTFMGEMALIDTDKIHLMSLSSGALN